MFAKGYQQTKEVARVNTCNFSDFCEFISEKTECVPTSLPKQPETVCKPTNGRKNVREPCCAETAVRNLPYNVVELLKQLDIGGFSDWKTLAGHLGNSTFQKPCLL